MKACIGEKRVNVFKYILAMTAACTVFAIMQGIHDNYGIMMSGLISMPVCSVPILCMLPVVLWLGYSRKKKINVSIQSETGTVKSEKLADILRFAFRDRPIGAC